MRVVLLVVLNMHMLRVIFDLICGILRCFLVEGHEQDLILFLELLLDSEMLAAIYLTLVSVDDRHAADLIE